LPSRLPEALAELARLEQKLAAGEPPCLCHNDLLPANFIDDGTRLSIIDWEYAGAGDRFFDLGNFAVNLQLDDAGEKALLTAYFGADRADDRRRLRLMRRVSDLREAMWGAVQAGISTLHSPDYYLDYGRKHLERFLSAGGRP
jgi:thiamine kinase-like enzyme